MLSPFTVAELPVRGGEVGGSLSHHGEGGGALRFYTREGGRFVGLFYSPRLDYSELAPRLDSSELTPRLDYSEKMKVQARSPVSQGIEPGSGAYTARIWIVIIRIIGPLDLVG